MSRAYEDLEEDRVNALVTLWHERFYGVDFLLLLGSPVYYGLEVPQGDNSGVVIIPGFMHSDAYLLLMYAWLKRLGYRPYYSGLELNADCPNLLIRDRISPVIDRARQETGGKIHLIGHSLGGIIARSMAAQRPRDIASVITLGSTFRKTVMHFSLWREIDMVRDAILKEHGSEVKPGCYTDRCTCDFMKALHRELPASVAQTAIYTRSDGVVDWHCCMTGNPKFDVEVPGTHAGLAFNPRVYSVIAGRLAKKSRAATAG